MPLSTTESLHAAIGGALADIPGVAFAVAFGSSVRGTAHARSDVDVALGFGICDVLADAAGGGGDRS